MKTKAAIIKTLKYLPIASALMGILFFITNVFINFLIKIETYLSDIFGPIISGLVMIIGLALAIITICLYFWFKNVEIVEYPKQMEFNFD